MTNSRAEEEVNEQKPEDLAKETSLKASVMQGLTFCVLRYKKVFILSLQH